MYTLWIFVRVQDDMRRTGEWWEVFYGRNLQRINELRREWQAEGYDTEIIGW